MATNLKTLSSASSGGLAPAIDDNSSSPVSRPVPPAKPAPVSASTGHGLGNTEETATFVSQPARAPLPSVARPISASAATRYGLGKAEEATQPAVSPRPVAPQPKVPQSAAVSGLAPES